MNFHGECGNGGVPTDYWDAEIIEEYLETPWEKEVWEPSDMIISRDKERGLILGRKATPSDVAGQAEIIVNGWDHEHCKICGWKISNNDDPLIGVGFRCKDNWLCVKCHHSLFGGTA